VLTAIELIDVMWLLICAALVMLMQGGFCCLETGLVRSKNSINVAIKNLMDFCIAVLAFWAFGYALMFGASWCGVIGTSGFAPDGAVTTTGMAKLLFQLVFCGTATTIVSGAVAERLRFSGYLVIAVLTAGLIYPVYGHWVWNGVLDGEATGWLARMGFIDFAGSAVVHAVGGWVALAGVLIIGPRLGRFSDEGAPPSGHNLPFAVVGVTLLWFGWFGFNGGSALTLAVETPFVLMNTCLAGAAGGVTAMVYSWIVHRQPQVPDVINGVIAALVGVTASCHMITPISAIAIGVIAAVLCQLATIALAHLKIDDVIGAFPAHGVCGMWGVVAVACFGDLDVAGLQNTRWEQFQIQLFGAAVCGAWAFGVGYTVLWVANRIMPLRASVEDERAGLNFAAHGTRTDLSELLVNIEKQRVGMGGDKITADGESTEAGQIAAIYNCVVDEIEQERESSAKLMESEVRIRRIIDSCHDAFISMDSDGTITEWNSAAEIMFGHERVAAVGKIVSDVILPPQHRPEMPGLPADFVEAATNGDRIETNGRRADGREFAIEIGVSLVQDGCTFVFNAFIHDVTDRRTLQLQLSQSQKLESMGQLAAGIAHEINTPTQYVGDNVRFLKDAFEDLKPVLECAQQISNSQEAADPELLAGLANAVQEADVEYLIEELPNAIDQSLEGVERVSKIVRAMKKFSHPNATEEKALVDINEAIASTVTVAKNEWKYVAELEMDFDDELVEVPCLEGDFNQVILNLIVNAAHAIKDRIGDDPEKGVIGIKTFLDGSWAVITVTDNGSGMPEEIKDRIFDPFFTTKDVGKGTGQGLTIAHSVVTKKHDGQIEVDSEVGSGTTFTLRLPLDYSEPTPVEQGGVEVSVS
jgi:Amt family ammonium transporter